MRELIQANEAAQGVMAEGNALLSRAVAALESGAKVTDTLRYSRADVQRQVAQDAVKRVIEARHELRLEVIAACEEAGVPRSVIATWWGISRQRVDQMAQELKRRPPRNVDASTPVRIPAVTTR